MVKLIVAVIIASVILAVLRIIWTVLWAIVDYTLWAKKLDERLGLDREPKRSSYREAFMLECTDDMVSGDPYAKRLDKAIKIIDKKEKKLEHKRRKVAEKLSKMK